MFLFPSLVVVLRCNIDYIGLEAFVFASIALTQMKPIKYKQLFMFSFNKKYYPKIEVVLDKLNIIIFSPLQKQSRIRIIDKPALTFNIKK